MEYGWILPKPSKRERFIRWVLRQPPYKWDYDLTFPVSQKEVLKPGIKIRTKRG